MDNSICAAGAGTVLYHMRDVTTSYIPCRFVIKSHACHVTFPRVFVQGYIRRWILSLLLFTLATYNVISLFM